MPAHALIAAVCGLILAIMGFTIAFRQSLVRRLLRRSDERPRHGLGPLDSGRDPLTYVLRIAGIMMMAFGIAVAGMLTVFNFT